MSNDGNPYAPPQTRIEVFAEDAILVRDSGPWRDGAFVVVRRNAPFPQRCVRCNAPLLKQDMKTRTFYWHTSALYLLVLLNLLIYALVAMFVRKRSQHSVGLCGEHLRRRRLFIAVGLSSIAMPFLGAYVLDAGGVFVGLVAAVVLAFVGIHGSRLMVARGIDERQARFAGCGKAFVDSLPPISARNAPPPIG